MHSLSPRDAADLYLGNLLAEGYVRDVTLRGYSFAIQRFLSDIDLPDSCRELTARHAMAWTAALRSRGLKQKSVRSYQAPVWTWFGWLFREGYTPSEISRQVRQVRVDDSTIKRRTATDDVIDKLLTVAAARSETALRNRAVILMLVATGARKTELAACDLEDLDLASGSLRLWRHTKAHKERWSGVNAAARQAMQLYIKKHRGEKPGPLFLVRLDGRMSAGAITLMIRSLAESAGVECSAHDFRRACAARMLAAGAKDDVVQYQLGHKTAYLTMQYGAAGRRDRSIDEYHELDKGVRRLRKSS